MKYVTIHSDCLIALKDLPDNSVDSLITDPPAGISFMGKAWDEDKGGRKQWVAWMTEVMIETMRVLKPGAHGFVWALPRTSHWTATALEDAGFEIRDVVTHLFGTGFPKSLDIGKTLPDWNGWGTALKPASEHWILVRKPCSEKTVAANVLKHGVGGLNINVSRIGGKASIPFGRQTGDDISANGNGKTHGKMKRTEFIPNEQGRFPANLVLSHSPYCLDNQCDTECAIQALDEQSGVLKSGQLKPGHKRGDSLNIAYGGGGTVTGTYGGDSGGASRFFYCAKISSKERGQGNTHPTVKSKKLMSYLIKLITPPGGLVLDPFMGSGSTGVAALENDFRFLGIEQSEEYYAIAESRLTG